VHLSHDIRNLAYSADTTQPRLVLYTFGQPGECPQHADDIDKFEGNYVAIPLDIRNVS